MSGEEADREDEDAAAGGAMEDGQEADREEDEDAAAEGATEGGNDAGEGHKEEEDIGGMEEEADAEDEAMDGEEADDNGDFHPLLVMQRSPSLDRESNESSSIVCETMEDVDDDEDEHKRLGDEKKEDGNFDEREGIPEMGRESEEFMGELDGDDKFFELATDYEEEEFEDVDQEEEDREYLEDCLNGMDYGESSYVEEGDSTALQNLDGLDGNGCSISAGNIASGISTQGNNVDEHYKVGEEYVAPCSLIKEVEGKVVRSDESDGEREDIMDPICKRTRARYSLTDMSLNQLETFLQESDEEEDFQTVAEKEEYEKFLRAVLEDEESNEQPEQSSRKEDEDDEEEDMDFDVEIEEALESDDTTESVRRSRIETRKRPETREKKRRRAQLHCRAPLRLLLPHVVGSCGNDFPKMNSITENGNGTWPINGKRRAPVSGFTAHQIGQLYCLMHEHVQLLVQVHCLCVFDPTKEQIAKDTHRMLQELVKERDSVLCWKKTAFPDFCFRPPYTHPSPPIEGEKPVTLLHSLTPRDTTTYTSTLCGQNGRVSSNMTFSHSSGQNMSSSFPRSYSFPKTLEYVSHSAQHYATVEHSSQQSTVISQSWQEGVLPNSVSRPRAQSAFDGASSSLTRTLTASYTAVAGPSGVDPGFLSARPSVSADCSLHPPSHGSSGDLPSVTANYCQSSVISPEESRVYPLSNNDDDCSSPPVANCGPLPAAMVQCPTFREGGPLCKSLANGPNERVTSGWAPVVSGPVRSLRDVAPLALVRDFLTNISQVVVELRQRHLEVGANILERVPIFAVAAEQDQSIARNIILGKRSHLLGDLELMQACLPPPQVKKTMAAALVESTKKQDFAPVPKEIAVAVQQFVPFFNVAMFPHKPPPVSTTSRILFTEAEDELLAMGMMEFNHDWSRIQQKFLPSKTVHQVFVRQKNRTSSKALDNSIKAVHRMKASPLSDWERKAIQEGLNYFKHDWNKVWSHCVKHRDPATLQRQWRIAAGTQKSYKTSETSKERRRVYEASRRQKIAARKTSNALSSTEDAPPPGAGRGEANNLTSKSKDIDDPDMEFRRAAGTDNWSLGSNPVSASAPTVVTADTKRKHPSKKRKPKSPTDNYFSSSQPWLDSQIVKCNAHDWKQTVKLAPGLPSVKLPAHVQVLSQSQVHPQQSFSFSQRLAPATPQWPSQRSEKLVFSIPTDLQPSSPWNPATAATTLPEGVTASQQTIVSSSLSNRRRKQMSSKKKSRPAPSTEDRGNSLSLQPIGDPAMASSLPFQNRCLEFWQHGHSQGDQQYLGETGSGPLPIQRLGPLPAKGRKKMPQKISTRQVRPDYQAGMVPRITPRSASMELVRCHVSHPSAAATTTSGGSYAGSELQFGGLQSAFQSSSQTTLGLSPPAEQQVKLKGMVASAVAFPDSDAPVDLTRRQDGQATAQDSAKQGERKVRKNVGKRNKKAQCENSLEGSLQRRTFFAVGDTSDPCTNIHHFSSRNSAENRNRKDPKHHDPFIEEGSQAPLFREQNIVMEREELSDSEDEADAGVEFEHEEMGDSDKDAEV